MKKNDICSLSIFELSKKIQDSKLSPVEVTEAYLERIYQLNPIYNTYISIFNESIQNAHQLSKKLNSKSSLPLYGIPIAIKDLFDIKGYPTTLANKTFLNNIASRDSTVIEKLKNAGAIILGKLNLHNIAFGTTNESSYYGPTHNPWNTEFITGGSSGGSAASVISNMCVAALGSDTGGSVRIPASLCGVVGLKPTYGLISTFGVAPLAPSLDHIGPLTKNVEDAALLLNVMVGYDPNDPLSIKTKSVDYVQACQNNINNMKIGVCKELFFDDIDDQTHNIVQKAIEKLEGLGAKVIPIEIPSVSLSRSVAFIMLSAEAASIHDKFLKISPLNYSGDVRSRLYLGNLFQSSHYLKAQKLRSVFINLFNKSMENIDVLISPTTPIPATKLGVDQTTINGKNKYVNSLLPTLTTPFNLTGAPSISIPCGFTDENLPIGLQISAKSFKEENIIRVAYTYEKNTKWNLKIPS